MSTSTPSPAKVYGPPLSTAVSRVLACLLEKHVPFQVINVDLLKREHKSPQYIKLQPFGQVPFFQDETISLFESRAICRYISLKYANKGNTKLYGTNPLEKASIEQWLEAESQSFNQPTLTLMFQLAYAPQVNIPQDEGLIKQNLEKLVKVLDVYNKRLAESKYLAGDEFTLADLSHLPNSMYLVTRTELKELFMSKDNVGRWLEEISGRESWKKVVEMQNSPPS
ncbi:hypothetical protein Cgig2_031939 [Carnegiea gigantea]|uniref:glutathione transferase n=1 Tax=Carnegiea gigantea TaxID=171969 RepID=A0A9Q1K6S5_9CARY|nr:hypothetical protein Cgig2_031939 [Carnegiea gigantea]